MRTKLIVFLTTPHLGSVAADGNVITKNLARIAVRNKATIRDLRPDSSMLDTIHEEFMKLLSESDIKLYSFQETRPWGGAYGVSGIVGQVSQA